MCRRRYTRGSKGTRPSSRRRRMAVSVHPLPVCPSLYLHEKAEKDSEPVNIHFLSPLALSPAARRHLVSPKKIAKLWNHQTKRQRRRMGDFGVWADCRKGANNGTKLHCPHAGDEKARRCCSSFDACAPHAQLETTTTTTTPQSSHSQRPRPMPR